MLFHDSFSAPIHFPANRFKKKAKQDLHQANKDKCRFVLSKSSAHPPLALPDEPYRRQTPKSPEKTKVIAAERRDDEGSERETRDPPMELTLRRLHPQAQATTNHKTSLPERGVTLTSLKKWTFEGNPESANPPREFAGWQK